MTPTNETIRYLFNFLCQDASAATLCAYAKVSCIPAASRVVVVASEFFDEGVFGQEKSLPDIPLQKFLDVPLLFGQPRIEHRGEQLIIYADLIASSFFLLSRYEETIKTEQRDSYGRFPGTASLPYRAGFIDRPIVDEYGRLLRALMREAGIPISEPEPGFSKIWLTHDIDIPWENFSLIGAIKRIMGRLKRGEGFTLYPLKNAFGYPEDDPVYTFNKINSLDKPLKDAVGDIVQDVYFVKSCKSSFVEDSFEYHNSPAFQRLTDTLTGAGALLGYHASFAAGNDPDLIDGELRALETAINRKVTFNRNHFLLSKEPEDFYSLINAGITDDYTMGYADVAGFRLGTSRAVRWIDPTSGQVTGLTLHNLTTMECSLFSEKYMDLQLCSAQEYTAKLIEEVRIHSGELALLWHNQSFAAGKDELLLYQFILHSIQLLCSKEEAL